MTEPLALLLYEKLLPGSQLANRLRDLRYRVQVISEAASLVNRARQDRPLIVLVDLASSRDDVPAAIAAVRQDSDTSHIPIIAFAPEKSKPLRKSAQDAGATLVVSETAILSHLDSFLEQALHVE